MIDSVIECAANAWNQWRSGGLLMLGLALLSIAIYYAAIEQWRDANRWPLRKLLGLKEADWDRKGALPNELSQAAEATGGEQGRARAFDRLRRETLQRMDRRMAYLAVLISTAPLTGLLGTVSGLMTTFDGLAATGGAVQQIVSRGVNEALVTTQTGLIIAIPAFAVLFALRRKREECAAAITHVESVAMRRFRKEVP